MSVSMLTTVDNPFDPFTNFDEWYAFDAAMGYDSCSYLSRIAFYSDDLSDKENDLLTEFAIDEIVTLNPLGIYKKVTRSESTT